MLSKAGSVRVQKKLMLEVRDSNYFRVIRFAFLVLILSSKFKTLSAEMWHIGDIF